MVSGSAKSRKALVAGLVLACGIVCTARAAAQTAPAGYQSLPFDEKFIVTNRGAIKKILGGSTPLEGQEEAFDAFFQRGIFAQMSRPENLGQLPDLRQDFLRTYVRSTRNPEAYERLVRLTLQAMPVFVAKNFHPAVRLNAILILGELDKEPAIEFGVNKAPPKPLPEAFPVLLKAYQAGSLPDAVKVGALLGIERHLQFRLNDLPADQRATVAQEMFNLATSQKPPTGRTASGHDWMRRRAIETLGLLAEPGGNNSVLAALVKIMTDPNEALAVRCQAAEAIGALKYDAAVKFDMNRLIQALAQLAADAGRYEEAAVRQSQIPSRRRLAQRLTSVRGGLKAPQKLNDAASAKALAAVNKALDEVMAKLDEPDLTDETFATFVGRVVSQLDAAAAGPGGGGPAKPAPVAPPANEDPFGAVPSKRVEGRV